MKSQVKGTCGEFSGFFRGDKGEKRQETTLTRTERVQRFLIKGFWKDWNFQVSQEKVKVRKIYLTKFAEFRDDPL